MISLDTFGNNKALVLSALETLNRQLSSLVKEPVVISIATSVDDDMLQRMLLLEDEIFRIEDNTYSGADILECLAEDFSLLLILTINGEIQGYFFGYDDDPDDPVVEGTEYFVDSAVVALKYQNKGIFTTVAGFGLLLLYLLGFRRIGITTEQKDKTGRELVRFYEKLGLRVTSIDETGTVKMKIDLDDAYIEEIRKRLNVSMD